MDFDGNQRRPFCEVHKMVMAVKEVNLGFVIVGGLGRCAQSNISRIPLGSTRVPLSAPLSTRSCKHLILEPRC